MKAGQSNGQKVGLIENGREFASTICAKNKEAALIDS